MNFIGSKKFLFLILTAGIFFAGTASAVATEHMTDVVPVKIINQNIRRVVPTAYLVEWETNIPTSGKVVYDTSSVKEQDVAGDYEYRFTTTETTVATTTHRIAVWGLEPALEYYLRPASIIGGSDDSDKIVIYGEESVPNIWSPVPGYISGGCNYITEFLKYGENNSPIEVMKLQRFLNENEGYSDVLTTGIFDEKTLARTKEFQEKYKEEILFPWGVEMPTGYVYITTTKKINELYCGREFGLSEEHYEKISMFSSEMTKLLEEHIFTDGKDGVMLPLTDFDSVIPPLYINEMISNEVGQNYDDSFKNNNRDTAEPKGNVVGNNSNFDYVDKNFIDKSFVVNGDIANEGGEEQEGVVFRIISSISAGVRRVLDWF